MDISNDHRLADSANIANHLGAEKRKVDTFIRTVCLYPAKIEEHPDYPPGPLPRTDVERDTVFREHVRQRANTRPRRMFYRVSDFREFVEQGNDTASNISIQEAAQRRLHGFTAKDPRWSDVRDQHRDSLRYV